MQMIADAKVVAAAATVDPGLSDKQSTNDSYGSTRDSERTESDPIVTGSSGARSPESDSRCNTPEPTEHSAKAAEGAEASGLDPRNTNLNHFHGECRFEQQISVGQFTKVRGLSECCRSDGKVELHHWVKQGHQEQEQATVVVKRVLTSRVGNNVGKEANERVVFRGHCGRHAEDCLNEIGVYCYLSQQQDLPQYILKMHTVFQSTSDVWLVLEHANQGDLFAVAQTLKREGKSLSTGQLTTWSWQLLQAVHYLHSHHIGHRDISMENVLLKDGHVCLMDFGQSVKTHSADGVALRYFNALGKPYYRPPECHCPSQKHVDVHVPQDARPGEVAFARTCTGDNMVDVLLPYTAVPGQVSVAEPWGYAVPPVDMFACGVCIFILTTGMPPWKEANLSDPHFAWVHQCGIAQLLQAWQKPMPGDGDELLAAMLQSDPGKRPSVKQCLSHTWFSQLRGADIPRHHAYQNDSTSFACMTQAAVAEFSAAATATYAKEQVDYLSGLQSSMVAGDPYMHESSVRNAGALIMESSSGFGGGFGDDFYDAPENNTRRSTDPCAFPAELTLQRFSAADLPPKAPVDDSFAFESTTLHIADKEPAALANQLIDYLTMAAGAFVKKVGKKKFTIKAGVDTKDGACTLKVRIYDQGEGTCAVEFQRREGDSAVFHKVFDQASEHFIIPSKSPKCSARKDATPAIEPIVPTIAVKDAKKDGAAIEKDPFAREVVAKHSRTAPPSPCTSQRASLGQSARSEPDMREVTSSTGNSKIAMVEALENLKSEKNNPVTPSSNLKSEKNNPAGSGLNAVRQLSKTTLR